MEYIITRDPQTFERIRPIFKASYSHLLGENWETIFEQAAANALVTTLIKEDDEIVAFSFHRGMRCSDWRSAPSYMADTPEMFRQYVENRFDMLTIEWLTVEPSRLGKFTKVQPGDLILGLGFHFMANSCFNATIGFSRQDTKVDKMTTRFGAQLFGTVERLGIPCSVVFVEDHQVKPHPITKTQEKIEQLWNQRINHFPNLERQKAA